MSKLDNKLDFYVKHNMNVLLSGEHGFGKTAMVTSCFERNGMRWRYFSAPTMDPWVDFVGVPKEVVGPDGVSYLDLIRPKEFACDEVEAIFFDEFNRAPAKVRNAVMELIQFKSINGKKFNNLKIIWAAINPPDDEETYNVEALDPAQLDRFQVHIDVPSKPSLSWFIERHGEKHGKVAVEWWHNEPSETRKLISARRLNDALVMFHNKGDIRDVLPKKANCHKLVIELSSGSILGNFKEALTKDDEELRTFLKNDNNYVVALDYSVKNDTRLFGRVARCISDERLMTVISDNHDTLKLLLQEDDITRYKNVLEVAINLPNLSGAIKKLVKSALYTRFSTSGEGISAVEFSTVNMPTLSYQEFSLELANAVKHSKGSFEQNQKNRIYRIMSDNLNSHMMVQDTDALHVLCICFRLAESSREITMLSTYSNAFKFINTALKRFMLESGEETFHDRKYTDLFCMKKHPYYIDNTAKVQGFLDTHAARFVFKPRILG